MSTMACHDSPDDTPFQCVGHAKQVGYDSPGFRIAVMYGVAQDPDSYTDGGHELYESFDEMMLALGHEDIVAASDCTRRQQCRLKQLK